ncbi:hypothetical protein BDE02_09G089900 [Populus trichocarpa]|nr:hypothetical protein BDE02_09G089900 [Populus trichocarpa]
MLSIEEHELHTRCLIKCLMDNVLPLTQQQLQKNKGFTLTKSKQK